MSSKSSFSNSTSKSYALALYEISKENSELDKIENEMKSFGQLLQESPDFKETILSPTVSKEDKKSDYYDRFRNRLMFPIHNSKGNVIAFGGRLLSNKDNPKYLNSPETPLFSKSKELYGL